MTEKRQYFGVAILVKQLLPMNDDQYL